MVQSTNDTHSFVIPGTYIFLDTPTLHLYAFFVVPVLDMFAIKILLKQIAMKREISS